MNITKKLIATFILIPILFFNVQSAYADKVIGTLTTGILFTKNIDFNSSTNKLYATDELSPYIAVIDIKNKKVIKYIKVSNAPSKITVNTSTNKIYVLNSKESNIFVIDGSNDTLISTVTLDSIAKDITVNPNTNLIYTLNPSSNAISIIDGANNTLLNTVSVGKEPNGIAINTSTSKIYVANSGSNSISVINTSTNKLVTEIQLQSSPREVAINQKTNKIYVTDKGKSVFREDYGTLEVKLYVIDGLTDSTLKSLIVDDGGSTLSSIAINSTTNKIYFATKNFIILDGNDDKALINKGPLRVNPRSLVVNEISNEIYSASENPDRISLIDGNTNEITNDIYPGISIHSTVVNPETNKIYITNTSANAIIVVDGLSGDLIDNIQLMSGETNTAFDAGRILVFNPNTSKLYISNPITNAISVFDIKTNQVIKSIQFEGGSNSSDSIIEIEIDPFLNKIFVIKRFSNEVTIINGSTDSVEGKIALDSVSVKPNAIGINTTTKKLFVTYEDSTKLTVINYVTGKIEASIDLKLGTSYSQSGNRIEIDEITNKIFVAKTDGVAFIDGLTYSITCKIPAFACGINFNPTNKKVYFSDRNKSSLFVVDASTSSLIDTLAVIGGCNIAINPVNNLVYFDQYIIDGSQSSSSNNVVEPLCKNSPINPGNSSDTDISIEVKRALHNLTTIHKSFKESSKQAINIRRNILKSIKGLKEALKGKLINNCEKQLDLSVSFLNSSIAIFESSKCNSSNVNKKCIANDIVENFLPRLQNVVVVIQSAIELDENKNDLADFCEN